MRTGSGGGWRHTELVQTRSTTAEVVDLHHVNDRALPLSLAKCSSVPCVDRRLELVLVSLHSLPRLTALPGGRANFSLAAPQF